MKFSLIVSTLGRFDDLLNFVKSLKDMKYREFELIIVDQNDGDRIKLACEALSLGFPFIYLNTSNERGLSRGRNSGIALATGDILCFPDDDCIYPPGLLGDVISRFEMTGADMICGRAATPEGALSMAALKESSIRKSQQRLLNPDRMGCVLQKSAVFFDLVGYDVDVGVGASTPWQACEGPEITLRALDAGFKVYYDPEIYAFHAELKGEAMARKVRGYARGMGYVFRIHSYKSWQVARYFIRPVGGLCLALMRLNFKRARHYMHVTIGRIEGFPVNALVSKKIMEMSSIQVPNVV